MLVILLALAGAFTSTCHPRRTARSSGSTTRTGASSARTRAPGASWVRNQYDRTCLKAKPPVNASSSTPDSLGYSPCESAAAFSRSCCSSSFGVSGSAGAAIVRQPLARPPPRSLLDP